MLFILAFGLVGLGASFYFAVRPQKQSLAFITSICQGTLFRTLTATAASVGATLYAASHVWESPGAMLGTPHRALSACPRAALGRQAAADAMLAADGEAPAHRATRGGT